MLNDSEQNVANQRNAAGRGSFMNSVTELGAELQRVRKQNGLTQEQLAELAGISERTLRSIERGAGNPSIEAVLSVADVLGLRIRVAK